MTGVFLYLTTKGRTSGLPRRIEIWFVEIEGRFYVVAEMWHAAGWVKNVVKESRVRFSVGSGEERESVRPEVDARARIVERAAEPELAERVGKAMDQNYGWNDGLIVEIATSVA